MKEVLHLQNFSSTSPAMRSTEEFAPLLCFVESLLPGVLQSTGCSSSYIWTQKISSLWPGSLVVTGSL